MPRKTEYVVRVVTAADSKRDTLLECLRYAQLVTLHEHGDDTVFDIICPHGLNSKTWSERNAARMKTFGFNAVSAPMST